ncbi:MAG: hypothetical protein QMD46_02320 [Methanomicrobiales archaeon]|nr:hypothetical protein [Methanomicrobiales archaeon]MDI6875273.1 hypothetical protein [Methanomicrobiales archaeon]
MQIPNGTVRSREKEVHLGDFLDSLGSTGFTGCCTVTFSGQSCRLVFGRGECILAEYQGCQGEAAWKGILRMKHERADAVLTDLTPDQIEAAISANRPFLVDPNHWKAPPRVRPSTTVIRPVAARGTPGRRVKVSTVSTSPAGASSPTRAGSHTGGQTQGRAASLEGGADRISLESLKGLRGSFKSDAATLLRDLDLEHLIVEVAEKENVKKTTQDTEKEGCRSSNGNR